MKSVGDVLALLSAVVFFFPAWYANRFGHRLAKINLNGLRLGEPEFQNQYNELMRELLEQRDGWKPWKAWCFYLGTFMGVLAAVILLCTGLSEPASLPGH